MDIARAGVIAYAAIGTILWILLARSLRKYGETDSGARGRIR